MPRIHYQHATEDPEPRRGPQVVNRHGDPIKLTTQQKNALYRQAKAIRETLPDRLVSRNETHHTEGHAIRKMLGSEFKAHGQIEYMKKCMKAIGADSKDYDTERLRRRR
jgi:hypothetical protein